MHDFQAILRHILAQYTLPLDGYHGPVHWARVQCNGLKVAEVTGADPEIVKLFALFHDSCRWNEGYDPQHGERGGNLARTLRGKLVHLDDARFGLFYEACRLHTDGYTQADVSIQACWDADRLDLGRVGTRPNPRYLCSAVACELIPWAHERAEGDVLPREVLEEWGLKE